MLLFGLRALWHLCSGFMGTLAATVGALVVSSVAFSLLLVRSEYFFIFFITLGSRDPSRPYKSIEIVVLASNFRVIVTCICIYGQIYVYIFEIIK